MQKYCSWVKAGYQALSTTGENYTYWDDFFMLIFLSKGKKYLELEFLRVPLALNSSQITNNKAGGVSTLAQKTKGQLNPSHFKMCRKKAVSFGVASPCSTRLVMALWRTH